MTSRDLSPLRYPGGKGALAPFLGRALLSIEPRCDTYVEPFAGGAGAAVRLLYNEYVRFIVLNDIDRGVAAFWRAVFHHTDRLVSHILTATVDVSAWREQRDIYLHPDGHDDLTLGFATFFLNRTNRSGILDAGPIGGLEQNAAWKIDARFNREQLAWRVRELGRYRNRVTIFEEDGIDLAGRLDESRYFIYADPPYLEKGSDLYLDRMAWEDHERLARVLSATQARWIVSYDHDLRVRDLYPESELVEFAIRHRAHSYRSGREYAVFGPGVVVESLDGLGTRASVVPWVGAVAMLR